MRRSPNNVKPFAPKSKEDEADNYWVFKSMSRLLFTDSQAVPAFKNIDTPSMSEIYQSWISGLAISRRI